MVIVSRLWKQLYAPVVLLAAWQGLTLWVGAQLVPSPLTTLLLFFRLLPTTLLPHVMASMGRILAALAIALFLGVSTGLAAGLHRRVDALLSPLVYGLYPLPKVAFMPLLMILFGLGNAPKVALIVLIIVFQIYVTTRDAVRSIPAHLFTALSSLDLPERALYTHLVFPAILPKLFTTLRVSIGIAVAVLFFAENFATDLGVGYFIMNSWSMVNIPSMYAGILTLAVLGFLLFTLLDRLEKHFCAWTLVGKDEE